MFNFLRNYTTRGPNFWTERDYFCQTRKFLDLGLKNIEKLWLRKCLVCFNFLWNCIISFPELGSSLTLAKKFSTLSDFYIVTFKLYRNCHWTYFFFAFGISCIIKFLSILMNLLIFLVLLWISIYLNYQNTQEFILYNIGYPCWRGFILPHYHIHG